MEIRSDFKSVEDLLQRVLVLARQLREFNSGEWVHLRNREDFDRAYTLPEPLPLAFEKLYVRGRDFAGQLSYMLGDFNYAGDYPTFKAFVDEVDAYVRDIGPKLREAVDDADSHLRQLAQRPFSVSEMVSLSRKQLAIGDALSGWVQQARGTELYRAEAAPAEEKEPPPPPASLPHEQGLLGWSPTLQQVLIGVAATVLGGLLLAAIL